MRNPFKSEGPKRVKIVPNQDILEGTERLLKGKTYRVDVNVARYFERNGWIEGSVAETLSGPIVLEVDEADHGHEGGF